MDANWSYLNRGAPGQSLHGSRNRDGDQKTANRRIIRQSIRPGLVTTCQLVMGFTELDVGNVWNTMPSHTHGRRSEIYLYFDAAPARLMHIMGEPGGPRTVFVDESSLTWA